MLKAHPSVPYNPAIANVFFRAGLIEAWGSGILRMITDCEKEKTPTPIFKYDFSGFIIEFDAKKETVSEKSSEKIIRYMTAQNDITIEELAQKIGVTTRAVEKQIEKLKKANRITRN